MTKKRIPLPDTMPPPTPDPSDIPPIPSSGAPGNIAPNKIDVIAMQAAAHDEAVATQASLDRLAAQNAATPMPTALEQKASRQANEVIKIFHEIRAVADANMRPALAAAALVGEVPSPILYALQGVLVAIDAADDIVTRVF